MPGKQGNRNAMTHGVYGYLAIGSLPKGASYIRRQLGQFERALRDAVSDEHGEISLYRAGIIQTACRHEGRAQLLTRWLREENSDLKAMDKVTILREIGAASDSRDRCLKALGLDRDQKQDFIDALYSRTETPDASPDECAATRTSDKASDEDNALQVNSRNDSGDTDDEI